MNGLSRCIPNRELGKTALVTFAPNTLVSTSIVRPLDMPLFIVRYTFLVFALLAALPVMAQPCPPLGIKTAGKGEVGISCQVTSVRLNGVSRSDVMTLFESFAKSEGFTCKAWLSPNDPRNTAACTRPDGIHVEVLEETEWQTFVSLVPFGLKGADTLRKFNARLAEALRKSYKESVEASPAIGRIPAKDKFSGVYVSESRENYGTEIPGDVRIEVTREEYTYLLKYFIKGKPLFETQAEECDPKKFSVGNVWPKATAAALCTPGGHIQIFHTEDDVIVPMVGTQVRAGYFSHVQWNLYAFRKVE